MGATWLYICKPKANWSDLLPLQDVPYSAHKTKTEIHHDTITKVPADG